MMNTLNGLEEGRTHQGTAVRRKSRWMRSAIVALIRTLKAILKVGVWVFVCTGVATFAALAVVRWRMSCIGGAMEQTVSADLRCITPTHLGYESHPIVGKVLGYAQYNNCMYGD